MKTPLSVIALLVVGAIAAVFVLFVPQGEHLISNRGDTILGIIVGMLLVAALAWDFKKLSATYRNYIEDNPKGYWFKRKWYGWGWTPVTWQGWVATLVYLALVVAFALTIDEASANNERAFTFILPVVLLTAAFIRLAYAKGEKPRWQWGPPEDTKK
jgi:hypothetical protein